MMNAEEMKEEELRRIRAEFMHNMCHDIRTPLNVINGMVHLAKKNIHDENAVKDCLEKISSESEHILSRLNDTFDIFRSNGGRLRLVQDKFETRLAVNETAKVMRSYAEQREAELEYDVDTELRQCYYGDKNRFIQIINNLVSNALKHTKNGGKVHVRIRLDSKTDEEDVIRIMVSGTEAGEEGLNKIFEPFEQIEDDSARRQPGGGIGLALVKQLAAMMGGWVHAENSVFTAVIKMIPAPQKNDANHTAIDYAETRFAGERILLVEDNELNMEIVKAMLEDMDLKVDTAMDGQEAVEAYQKAEPGHYKLIFMDISMPVYDGMEATRRIRKLEQTAGIFTPIVAMTANAFREDREEAIKCGMNGYITKPVAYERIIDELIKYI